MVEQLLTLPYQVSNSIKVLKAFFAACKKCRKNKQTNNTSTERQTFVSTSTSCENNYFLRRLNSSVDFGTKLLTGGFIRKQGKVPTMFYLASVRAE